MHRRASCASERAKQVIALPGEEKKTKQPKKQNKAREREKKKKGNGIAGKKKQNT